MAGQTGDGRPKRIFSGFDRSREQRTDRQTDTVRTELYDSVGLCTLQRASSGYLRNNIPFDCELWVIRCITVIVSLNMNISALVNEETVRFI